MKTTLNYTKKRMNINLMLGIIWFGLGASGVLFIDNTTNIWSYGWMVLGALYIAMFIWERRKQYVTLTEKSIKKNKLKPIEIELKKITQIRRFSGDINIISEEKKITINTNLITEESKAELETFLKPIEVRLAS